MRLLPLIILSCLPSLIQGQFCTSLASDTWEGLVEAVEGSFRLAVLCPFHISGDGCPSPEEASEGLVLGRDGDIMIVECDPDLSDRHDDNNSKCIIDCPGRHFTVGPGGLILTNMVLKGATKSSILVEPNGNLEVVNTQFIG